MKNRSIGMMIVLYLITFGIYGIYWQCSFQNQLKQITGKGFGGAGHFFATLFTFGIYGIYWQYAAGKRLVAAGAKNDYSTIYLIISLIGFGIINMFLMQDQANKIQ